MGLMIPTNYFLAYFLNCYPQTLKLLWRYVMRREYVIEGDEQRSSIESVIANMIAIFLRHGMAVMIEGNHLVLVADSVLQLEHQKEMAERAVKQKGFQLKLTSIL
jgi:hypothetical protein